MVKTPRSKDKPLLMAERKTLKPDTGSLRDRMTTSTNFLPSWLKVSSLLTKEKATPGLAATSSLSSCSFL